MKNDDGTDEHQSAPGTTETEEKKRPYCVLVAEDDDDIRAMIAVALRRDSYVVIEAKDGAELLDHIGSSMLFRTYPPPDVIVTDIRMPGFSGLDVLAGLRSADWHTPTILITAYGSESLYEQAAKLGADAVFAKPFDIDDLRTAVLNMVPSSPWNR